MEFITSHSLQPNHPWHTHFASTDQTLEVYFTDEVGDTEVENCLRSVQAAIKLIPIKTFLINDNKIKKNALGLDWKIIEASWKSFCSNGGEKIVVIHQSELPVYMQKIYTNALEKYGIPIELEFKTSKHSTINKTS